jgi:beta-galactosidase/beta-glucuronidase
MRRKILVTGFFLCLLFNGNAVFSQWRQQNMSIKTRWSKPVNIVKVLPEYPRPQLVRSKWTNLNGLWEYAISGKEVNKVDTYNGKILVPYPIESALSGVKKKLEPTQLLWYKRSIAKPVTKNRERILLHFGAVDFEATVFINGKEIGNHKGGYQNFSFDVTNDLKPGNNELLVKVWDPSDQGPNPHGKQVLNPQGIMYTPSSGIWQTVWMETVPADYIDGLVITPDVDASVVKITVKSSSNAAVELKAAGQTLKGNTSHYCRRKECKIVES